MNYDETIEDYPTYEGQEDELEALEMISVPKDLVLYILYYENMWKALAMSYVMTSPEAEKFGIQTALEFKKRFPTTEAFEPMLSAILQDPQETLRLYDTLLSTIKEPETIITDVQTAQDSNIILS